ncbi:MAG: GNAT family N-acetyltransferase, partial [Microvirga sp.]
MSSASASLVLRPAAAPDLVEIRALLVETWHDTYDPLFGYEEVASFTDRLHAVEKLAGELGRASHVFLVAEREDGLAGTVSATLGDDRVLTIGRLYVRPAQQRAGIGRALLEAALAAFPTAQVARLEVERGNAKGRAFYERNGFTWTAKIGHAGAGEALVYERPLPGALPRLARDEDAQDLFGLLALCFAEYPGCYVDPHEDLSDLRDPSRSFAARGGAFWVAEDQRGRVCASIAIDYPAERTGELHRLYVRPDQRRRGLGERLIRL